MSSEREPLERAIAGLEAQRPRLGDAVVDAAIAPLRARLAGLDGADLAAQTLRWVTILFLDVVGSTALAQTLDAEDMHAALDGLLARGTAVVQAFGGQVLQYAGDNLLAVFGADAAREDDARRAVLAGLALLDAGRRWSEEVAAQHAHAGVGVRVGLHSGQVLLGGGVDGAHSIRGSAVHVAARMEQSAPPGGLRISQTTFAEVRGAFVVQPQAPLVVKGVDEPMQTYLVQAPRSLGLHDATRGVEGVTTPMIGREAELARLQQAFEQTRSRGKLVHVTIIGEAGLGKSRLLHEFERWLLAQPEVPEPLGGRALPQTRQQPFGLLRDVLTRRLQRGGQEPATLASGRLESAFAALFRHDGGAAAQAHAHLVGHLIGLDHAASEHIRGIRDDVKQLRSRAFLAIGRGLRRLAERRSPMVLMLDDLHDADDESLELLDHLAEAVADLPILLIGLTRPALFERRGAPSGPSDTKLCITLHTLGAQPSAQLSSALLAQLSQVPPALHHLVVSHSGGNPFYMEELVRMLIDERFIQVGPAGWSVDPDRPIPQAVPTTLVGVLQARLDRLSAREKLTLQQAAVVGFVFWDGALESVDPQAPHALPALLERELIVPRWPPRLGGAREFAFAHQILHQVTYDTLLKNPRRIGHAQAAAWLIDQAGDARNEFLGEIAEHFERADRPEEACEYCARAADYAAARFSPDTALAWSARALRLLEARPTSSARDSATPMRWRLHGVRERMHDLQARRDDQRTELEAMQRLAAAEGDDRWRAEVAWRRAGLGMRTGAFDAMAADARAALDLAQRIGEPSLERRAQQRLALALGFLGDLDRAQQLAHDGLTCSRAAGDRQVQGLFLNTLALIANWRDDPVATLEWCEATLTLGREIGDRMLETRSLGNLGLAWLGVGERVRALSNLKQGLARSRELGDHTGDPYVLISLSLLERWQGHVDAALDCANEALQWAIAGQNTDVQSNAWRTLGHAELALGHHEQALQAFERVRTMATARNAGLRFDAACGIAQVALDRGQPAAAWQALHEVLEHIEAGGNLDAALSPLAVWWTCCDVLARNRAPNADAVLASAHAELQRKADAINDPAFRAGFVSGIPEHLAIADAWQARASHD